MIIDIAMQFFGGINVMLILRGKPFVSLSLSCMSSIIKALKAKRSQFESKSRCGSILILIALNVKLALFSDSIIITGHTLFTF